MEPKTINAIKYVAAVIVAAAGGLLLAAHPVTPGSQPSVVLPGVVEQVLGIIVAIGSALGIVSSGRQPPTPPPPEDQP